MLQNKVMSRRSFLQGSAGVVGATVLGGGLLVTLSGCDAHETAERIFRGKRTITDHAGRELQIPTPEELERVYFTSSLAQVFVYSLRPELMAGTTSRFTTQQMEYLLPNLEALKYMGSFSENGEIDREAMMAAKVQLVFSISGIELTEQNISEAETFQEQTDIPVVLIDGSFDKISEAYRFLGDLIGAEQRAEEIASYLEQIYADVTEAVARVPEDKRVSLYYAEGGVGLQTDPDESQHALTFKVGGAINVAADVPVQHLGMSNVSLEQVLAWDPEVIVAWSEENRGGADTLIRTMEDWKHIRAVNTGRVYTMPDAPFSWCDRPPGVNRFIGIQWVANMLYPDVYDVDMVEKTKEFYRTLYWVEISDEQAKSLLGNSYPPYRG